MSFERLAAANKMNPNTFYLLAEVNARVREGVRRQLWRFSCLD